MTQENDSLPEPSPTPGPEARPEPKPARHAWFNPWALIALAALLLAGWQWQETRRQLAETQALVARRLADADAGAKEERGAQKQLREEVDALQSKLGAVEGKLTDFQGQTEALQTLYQELTRSGEEAALLEAERAITLASQQLQLAGNVPVAVLALQSADTRLARLDRPQYLPLRKALAKDLAALNALPFVDVSGISVRLEQLIGGIDKLPLGAYGRPPETPEKQAPENPQAAWWQSGARQIWHELRGLVRIQRFDREEPALLAPGQDFFLRENLKLRLLNARLALLSHDQWTFRNELKFVENALGRYFVADDPDVKSAEALLKPMLATEINVDLPTLNDSLAALRLLRSEKEKR